MWRRASLAIHACLMVGATLALVFLSGCAFTITYAAGKDSAAKLYHGQLCAPVGPVGERRTETTEYDDRVGFKPQVESVTTTTEPAPAQPPVAAEVKGAAMSKPAASIFRGLSRVLCFATLGILC